VRNRRQSASVAFLANVAEATLAMNMSIISNGPSRDLTISPTCLIGIAYNGRGADSLPPRDRIGNTVRTEAEAEA
jgi:hypothetical protein